MMNLLNPELDSKSPPRNMYFDKTYEQSPQFKNSESLSYNKQLNPASKSLVSRGGLLRHQR